MNESREVAKWLVTTLQGDAALAALVGTRVYRDVAPESAALPFVIFWNTGGHDVLGVGGIRILSELTFTVEGVCDGASATNLEAIVTRLYALLDRASGVTTAARILSCIREATTDSTDIDGGRLFPRLGGDYRLQVMPR